jgi:hypothetical protein
MVRPALRRPNGSSLTGVAARRPYPVVLIYPSSVLRRLIAAWRESVSFNMAQEKLNFFDSQ